MNLTARMMDSLEAEALRSKGNTGDYVMGMNNVSWIIDNLRRNFPEFDALFDEPHNPFAMLHGDEQSDAAITETVESLRADFVALTERVKLLEDDAEARAHQVHVLLNPERNEVPTRPQPAEEDEVKWEAVEDVFYGGDSSFLDARDEMIRQGLAAKPIDPNDERLAQVVARAMQDDNQGDCACVMWPCAHAWDYMARVALMSIATAQQEGAK